METTECKGLLSHDMQATGICWTGMMSVKLSHVECSLNPIRVVSYPENSTEASCNDQNEHISWHIKICLCFIYWSTSKTFSSIRNISCVEILNTFTFFTFYYKCIQTKAWLMTLLLGWERNLWKHPSNRPFLTLKFIPQGIFSNFLTVTDFSLCQDSRGHCHNKLWRQTATFQPGQKTRLDS